MKKGVLDNVTVTMNTQAKGATKMLAEALRSQANANELNSRAMLRLAEALKPIEVCGIKITSDGIDALGIVN